MTCHVMITVQAVVTVVLVLSRLHCCHHFNPQVRGSSWNAHAAQHYSMPALQDRSGATGRITVTTQTCRQATHSKNHKPTQPLPLPANQRKCASQSEIEEEVTAIRFRFRV